MNNLTTNEGLVAAIMEVNKHLRPSITDVCGDQIVELLTKIKDINKGHNILVSENYGSALDFICKTITDEGWDGIEQRVKDELIEFLLLIYCGLNKKIDNAKSDKSEDILQTINIYKGLLSRNNRI